MTSSCLSWFLIIKHKLCAYRPGTVGGYQPVYVVVAAPEGNIAYPGEDQS